MEEDECEDAYSLIVPGLYVGRQCALYDPEFMSIIDAVVSVTSSPKEITNVGNKEHLNLRVDDSSDENISIFFNVTYWFIDQFIRDGKKVFVHCHAGMSRSVTIVAHYLMRRYGKSVDEAIAIIRKHRPIATPNPGFILQLKETK
jgi:protein-tyrosine phosphatase